MAPERRDSVFLTLAPETSKTYAPEEAARASSLSTSSSNQSPETAVASGTTHATKPVEKSTRSDSVSSTGSGRLRFLKLNPVHYGGNSAESDFVEVEEE